MNDEIKPGQSEDGNDTLTALLKLAGPSAEIERSIEERVYANVRREWIRGRGWTRPMRWALPLAAAATVLLVVGLQEPDTAPQLRAVGSVTLAAGESGEASLALGDKVFVGDVLDTSNRNGMSLELRDAISLRVDADSLLRIDSATEFTLLAGQVYIDTGDTIYAERHVVLNTASGTATDIGTQFLVHFENADMSVAVREGRVDIREDGNTHSAQRGERVTVRPGTAARLEKVPLVGEPWDWAVALAPMFDIEDQSLLDLLKWVSREMGMGLRIESDEMRMETMQTRLHGSVDGMTPMQALDAVLATTQFRYSIDGNTIFIRK